MLARIPTEVFKPFAELDRFFGPLAGGCRVNCQVDVREDAENLYLDADVPGFAKGDLAIELEDGVLTISGTRAETTPSEGESYQLRERRSGSFTRRFDLPAVAEQNSVSATLTNGVLTVIIRKKEEAKPRKIVVN